jgi:hypothetical protein
VAMRRTAAGGCSSRAGQRSTDSTSVLPLRPTAARDCRRAGGQRCPSDKTKDADADRGDGGTSVVATTSAVPKVKSFGSLRAMRRTSYLTRNKARHHTLRVGNTELSPMPHYAASPYRDVHIPPEAKRNGEKVCHCRRPHGLKRRVAIISTNRIDVGLKQNKTRAFRGGISLPQRALRALDRRGTF